MRNFISVIALAGAATQLAAAQSPDLIGCATAVLSNIKLPNCSPSDISCLCGDSSFLGKVKDTITQKCMPSAQTEALTFAENLCKTPSSAASSAPSLLGALSGAQPLRRASTECSCPCEAGSGSPSPSSSASGTSPESTPSSGSTPGGAVPVAAPPSASSPAAAGSSSAAVPSGSSGVSPTNAPSSSSSGSGSGSSPSASGASPAGTSGAASPSDTVFHGSGAQSLPSLVAPLAISFFAALATL
ncbi:hypothetical protein DTO166G4_8378 [Paecilomyces variotii]|nr:hypothetical protein DTO166G4_8378 [Paecilomyces variotii]KAJ9229230.1 hypothetical protein DTO166G5_8019 [Paecilomyces variotii]KAJ9300485.1 hypothetical protein DTO217A2_7859 [Paecilomyces variotii]